MITGVGLREVGKAPAGGPIEVACIHNRPTDQRTMPAYKLSSGMDDDIRAPFKRPAKVGRGKSIVDYQRQASLASNLCHFLKGEYINQWISQGLTPDQAGIWLMARRSSPDRAIDNVVPIPMLGRYSQLVIAPPYSVEAETI
jgi:hypothetical protein